MAHILDSKTKFKGGCFSNCYEENMKFFISLAYADKYIDV